MIDQGKNHVKQSDLLFSSSASQRLTVSEAEIQARRHARSLRLVRMHQIQELDYLCFAHTRHKIELRDPGPENFRVLQAIMVFLGNSQSGFLLQLLGHADEARNGAFWLGCDKEGPFERRLDHFLKTLPQSLPIRLFTLDHKGQDLNRARQRMKAAIKFAQSLSETHVFSTIADYDHDRVIAHYLKLLGSALTVSPDDMQEKTRLDQLANIAQNLPLSLRVLYALRLIGAAESTFVTMIPENTEARSLAHEALSQLRHLLAAVNDIACDFEESNQ